MYINNYKVYEACLRQRRRLGTPSPRRWRDKTVSAQSRHERDKVETRNSSVIMG